MSDEEAEGALPTSTLRLNTERGVLFAQIAAPPMNLLGPQLVHDLVSLVRLAEADDSVRVIVFKSSDPDYFISHVDLTRVSEYRAEAARLTGEASIAGLFRYISASRLVTIAQIEGRVRGAGSEFALACDLRFAARETAIFGQFEPAFGQVPAGGGGAVLDAADGSRASARGDVERRRLRCRPAAGHIAVKQRVNAISLAPVEDFRRDSDLFRDSVGRAETQRLIQTAMKHGLQTRDAELDFAAMLGVMSEPGQDPSTDDESELTP